MSGYFITSTGTGVGKTFVTCALTQQAIEAGYKVNSIKPVISGYDPSDHENDVFQLISAKNMQINEENVHKTTLYTLKMPISPDMSAKYEQKILSFPKIMSFCAENAQKQHDFLFIEGIGGVMTPLVDDKTVLDLIGGLNLPTIMVAGSYLGSISHCLTALEAMKSKNILVQAIIVSESSEPSISNAEVQEILSRYTNIPTFSLPRIASGAKNWQNAPNLLNILEHSIYDQKKAG